MRSYNLREEECVLRIAIGITTMAILLLTGSASAAMHTVNASVGSDYTKIQEAINNASVGDTILVYSGTYYENVNVTKQLILIGIDNGGGMPVVDGSKNNAIEIKASGVTLDGFNPVNSSYGIYVNSNNNTILNNNASNGAEIKLLNSDNNILSDNLANYNSFGIYLENSDNNIISSNTANWNSYSGIHLVYCNNNTLNGNSVNINKEYGIYMGSSDNNTLIDNNAYSSNGRIWIQSTNDVLNQYNIGKGIYLHSSHQNTLKGNNVNFNNLIGIDFDKSDHNILIGNNVSSNEKTGISLRDSNNNMMSDNNLIGLSLVGDDGISVSDSDNITLSYNNVSNFDSGISLSFCDTNKLIENNASNNHNGVVLKFSNNNTLSGNNVSNNDRGILQQSSSNNTLSGNIINSNRYSGIWVGFCNKCLYSVQYSTYYSNYTPSNNNTMSDNIVSNNNDGIYFVSFEQNYSSNNRIYHNNIINNINQSYDNSNFNFWDSGYIDGGNYWNDYTGIDANGDGIGDTPYNISGGTGAQDRYPLMEPWNEDNILIHLNSGYNLISLPLIPDNSNVNSVLSPISGNYSIVWAYNVSDTVDHWKKYDPAASFGNDLTTMEPGKGYWIMMTSDDTLNISGTMAEHTDIELWSGWNLIGYNSPNPQTITDALSSINGNYSIIWAYNASDSTDHWKKYDPSALFGNDLANMEAGKGYWIMMTTDDILEI